MSDVPARSDAPLPKLSRREIAFAKAYLETGRNISRSAVAARPDLEGRVQAAYQYGAKLLKKPSVRAYIAELVEGALGDAKLAVKDQILKTLMVRAFYKPSDIINSRGGLTRPLSELGDLELAVDGVEEKLSKEGSTIVVKLADRDRAMADLQKFLGISEDMKEDRSPVQIIVLPKHDYSPEEWMERFSGMRKVGEEA